jgi:allantoin racemase
MRLCWLHPTTRNPDLSALWDKLETTIRPCLRPDTEVEFRFPTVSANFTRSLYAEHLNSVHMIEAALQAEADGFDGVFLACWNDALWEAREVLKIPVASVGEQSMLAALTMGRRFAVVTVSEKTATAIEMDLFAYGLRDRAIARPVRSVHPPSDGALLRQSVSDPFTGFIPRFEGAARACIADGAEVILVGCGYYGPLLRNAGYLSVPGTGVPVLDAAAIGMKYLEAMTDIARTCGVVKSTRGTFSAPEEKPLLFARQSLGFG